MEGILIASATGGSRDGSAYEQLRREFMADAELGPLLPAFVRSHRTLDSYWPFIKSKADKWAERRQYISGKFNSLIDYLERRHHAPSDNLNSDTLATFDADGVHSVWEKAIGRRQSDPEGAITVAKTLLESVCKRILDERAVTYNDKDDLPKIYGLAVRELRLAPDQHKEEPIKAILGGAMNLVNGLGTLRNRFSDAHAQGGKSPVKPSERHAKLAVNMAGAMATFLIETYLQSAQDGKS